MNYALLWIDALMVWLLWIAFFAACIGRLQRRWAKRVLLIIVFLVPLIPLGAFLIMASAMKFEQNANPSWFAYALTLILAYLIGGVAILWQAVRQKAGLGPAAANWRRVSLALAFFIVIGVGYMALLNMDVVIRARCAILGVKVAMQYWAAAPAVVSENQNAANIYEKAFEKLRKDPGTEVNNPPLGRNDNFDPNEPATLTFLARQAETIAMLRQAAALPACRFDGDLGEPDISAILSIANHARLAADVLDLDARENLSRGHAGLAIKDTAAVLQMSRQFGQRPMIISALVGLGIDAMGDNMLERALPAVRNAGELDVLNLPGLMPLGRMIQQALRGEEQYGLNAYFAMYSSQTADDQGGSAIGVRSVTASVNPAGVLFRVFFMRLDDYTSLLQECQADALKAYYKIRPELAEITHRHWTMLVSLVAQSFAREFVTEAKVEASDRCAQAAVAVTRYRLDHGALPSGLSALVPAYLDAIPIDPFDGRPIRLAIKGDKWIIYSVGPDAVDNGGKEMNNKGKGDITFTLAAAASGFAQPSTIPSVGKKQIR